MSDLLLVRRMLDGDESAFDAFFDVVYPALFRFALPRLGFDEDAAEEVSQAAVCKAIQKLHTFRGEAALMTWVCTFCRHEIYAHTRRNAGRIPVELAEDDPEIRAALESLRGPVRNDPAAAIDRARLATVAQRALEQLPAHYADALEWKYIDEVPVQEIAQRLGLGPKAAESVLTRARIAFRDAFQTLAAATRPTFSDAPYREC